MNLIGNVFGAPTGYQIHTYNCAKALIDAGVDLAIQTQPIDYKLEMDANIVEACKKRMHDGAATEMIMLAEQWRFKLADRLKLIGYLVFEGDKIPLTWEKACSEPEILEIWCPSKHTKDSIRNAGVDKPIHIIPHGFNENIFKPKEREENEAFRFLYVGGWSRGINDRKNVSALVKAFKDEFKPNEKAELVLKINLAYGGIHPIQALNEMKPNLKDGAPVHLITDFLPEERLAELYQSSDVFSCVSRAEGFGMPYLEAMGCGNYIISTNFGGQIGFIPKWNKIIGGELKPCSEFTDELYYERSNWLEVDYEKLKESLRWAFENREKVKISGEKNAKYALKDWKWSDVSKKIIKRMEEI